MYFNNGGWLRSDNRGKNSSKGHALRKERIFNEGLKVKEAKRELIEEYKKDLPTILQEGIQELVDELSKMEEVKGLTTMQITELIRPKKTRVNFLYTADEMRLMFDYYRKMIVEINKFTKYPPSRENFCAFASFSSATYSKYLNSDDEEMQEIMLLIDDYIKDSMLTSAQLKEIDNITTMFRGKAEHGMVEAQTPIVIEHTSNLDKDKILRQLDSLKKGGSLNPYIAKKIADNEYEVKE